jgi:hypothetical protein
MFKIWVCICFLPVFVFNHNAKACFVTVWRFHVLIIDVKMTFFTTEDTEGAESFRTFRG